MSQSNNTITNSTFQKVHKTGFTVIGNDVTMDSSLSLKERGMILTLMSLPDNWRFSVQGLTEILPEAKNTINRILNSLEEKGYLKREMNKSSSGKITGWKYIFADYPMFLSNEQAVTSTEPTVSDDDIKKENAPSTDEINDDEQNESVSKISLSQKLRYGDNSPYRKNDDKQYGDNRNDDNQNESQYNKHKYNKKEYNKQEYKMDRLIDRLINKGYSEADIENVKKHYIYQDFGFAELEDQNEITFIESVGYADFVANVYSRDYITDHDDVMAEEEYYRALFDVYESVVDDPSELITFAKHPNVNKQIILDKLHALTNFEINQWFSDMSFKVNTTSEIDTSPFKARLNNYLETCIYNYRPTRRTRRASQVRYAN